jgi:hypothetical protein
MNQMIFEQMEAINAQLAGLSAQNRANEQMGYQTASNQQQPGKIPGQPEVNPRDEAKAVTLRSGTHYAPPGMPPADDTDRTDPTRPVSITPVEETSSRTESTRPTQVVKPLDMDHTKLTRPVQKSAEGQKIKEANKPPPYRPPVPFPRRLAETKLNDQFAKFVDVIKQLQITIPFTEALTQMPTYAKFLKDILSNK